MSAWSYWERKVFFDRLDVVIIGGGFVGLSTGISLLEKNPGLKVLIVDRRAIPYGASTRNAGFACFGSPGELLDDLSKRSPDEVFALFANRYQGIRKLIQRTGPAAIEMKPEGGYELLLPEHADSIGDAELHMLNQGIEAHTGLPNYFYYKPELLKALGLNQFGQIICNDHEACIHPLKTLQSLQRMFQEVGGKLLSGIPLCNWQSVETGALVQLDNIPQFHTRQLLFCVNGFAKQFFPDLDVQAARNSVLILKTHKAKAFTGCYHVEKGYLYFRKVDDQHLLLGGGRHWALQEEFSDVFLFNERIRNKLLHFAETYILEGADYEVTDEWTGIMGLGQVKSPIVQMVQPNVAVAVRMGGMGVALASLTGEDAAQLLYQNLF